jgi:[ribosomal protein S18]-alanine N-acetyltransferase
VAADARGYGVTVQTSTRAAADVKVVRMRSRHLGGVLAIERRVYPRPWSPQLFAAELERTSDRRYLVAVGPAEGLLGRRPVLGYAGVMAQPGQEGIDAHITTVAVDPGEHRRKIASRLLVTLLREAIGLGARAATLEVRTANRGAQRLYAAFGFAPVGVRPRYYAETGEDALIMWAHDIAEPDYAERLDGIEAMLVQPGGSSGAPDEDVPWVQGRVGLARQRSDVPPETSAAEEVDPC